MNKKIKITIGALALTLGLSACGQEPKENNPLEKIQNQLEKEINEGLESVKESETTEPKETEEEKLTATQRFAKDYFDKFFAGELDLEKTYVPEQISQEEYKAWFETYKSSLEFEELKEKYNEEHKITNNSLTDKNEEAFLEYEIKDEKVFAPSLLKKDIKIIGLNEKAQFEVNGVKSSDLSVEKEEDGSFTLAFALPKTTIKVDNEVLEDFEWSDRVADNQEVDLNTSLAKLAEGLDEDALNNHMLVFMQKLLTLSETSGSVTDKAVHFEEGAPDGLITATDGWFNELYRGLQSDEKAGNRNLKLNSVKIESIKLVSNDLVEVKSTMNIYREFGGYGNKDTDDYNSTMLIKLLPEGKFIVSRYSDPTTFIEK